jgi:predicted unusual protein kinase regulating ubiquinone biosynthesis (AarF/ABC1/UbiB family)
VTDRAQRRFVTELKAGMRGLLSRARDVLSRDPDDPRIAEDAERAQARTMAAGAAELKGGMAKVAQMMAYLEGPGSAVDPEARAALGALWDQAPGEDPVAIRGVVEAELGQPVAALFARWDVVPMAAASLGEVHGARTPEGQEVAVKVQYPGVAAGLRSDLESTQLLRRLAGNDVGAGLGEAALGRLRDAVLAELDYVAERQAMDLFAQRLRAEPGMVVPKSFAALSSARVLTAERIDGAPLLTWAAGADAAARAQISLIIFRFAWVVPLVHGVFNADPNPGNYLVLDGQGQVGFLDYGCAATLAPEVLASERKLWRALAGDAPDLFRHALVEEGLITRARSFDLGGYREWERFITAPFRFADFVWTAAYARDLAALTSELVRAQVMTLGPEALLLWRQRLGVAAVLGAIGATAPFAAAMQDGLGRVRQIIEAEDSGWG